MDKAHIPSLEELLEMAQIEGVEFIVCRMTLDMMELDESKLLEGTIVWPAEEFINYAKKRKICIYI
jgi:peroxiredoxin family protein